MIDTDLPRPCAHGICLDSPDGCRFGPDGDWRPGREPYIPRPGVPRERALELAAETAKRLEDCLGDTWAAPVTATGFDDEEEQSRG